MTRLQWDKVGERLYETGTDRGVLFVKDDTGEYGEGVAWNGLRAVTQSPEGGEETPLWADNIKYLSLTSAEELKGNISAYTYPDEFMECDGSKEIAPGVYAGQQTRRTFAISYRNLIGNDTRGNDYGYKIHLIWGAKATPSERAYETVNDDPSAIEFGWDFTTTPESIKSDKIKPTSYICVDSTKVGSETLKALEAMLYGDESTEPKMPTVDEVIELIETSVTGP